MLSSLHGRFMFLPGAMVDPVLSSGHSRLNYTVSAYKEIILSGARRRSLRTRVSFPYLNIAALTYTATFTKLTAFHGYIWVLFKCDSLNTALHSDIHALYHYNSVHKTLHSDIQAFYQFAMKTKCDMVISEICTDVVV